jgi:GNAT superfamily N-acetyltransferase
VVVGDRMPDAVTIDRLGPDEVVRTASEHVVELPHGFFTQLGERFVARYHRSFVASPFGVALAARRDGELVGVLLGTHRNRAHYRWVVHEHGVPLALVAIAALVSRPGTAVRLLRTRWRRYTVGLLRLVRRRTGRSPAPAVPGGGDDRPEVVAVLAHMWVSPAGRRQGVGRRLVDAFVREVTLTGSTEAHLVTLADGDGAGPFYERLGWEPGVERVDPDGRLFRAYRRRLTASSSPVPPTSPMEAPSPSRFGGKRPSGQVSRGVGRGRCRGGARRSPRR